MRAEGDDVDYDILKLLSDRCLCNYRYIFLEVLLGYVNKKCAMAQ
jgi:hypothetical protein